MPTPLHPQLHLIDQAMRIGFAGALALLGLTMAGTAYAVQDQPCAAFGALVAQPASSAPDGWLAALGGCQNDATFLATLGDLLNQNGRYHEASEYLERALLLNAELKGAQLSYAIALAGIGDTQAAEALLDALLADPSLPGHLRVALLKQRQWQNTPALQTRFTLSARWGHDSNLLGAPNLTDLALTLPGQTLLLPLDPSYLAHPGQYYRTDAQFELRRLEPNGSRWDLSASLRNRHSPAEPLAAANQADFMLEHSRPPNNLRPDNGLANLGHYIYMSTSLLAAESGTRYGAAALAGGVILDLNQASAPSCRARFGAEWQARSYQNNKVLSGNYIGLTGNVSCEPRLGAQWLLGLKAGRDTPQNPERPGAAQNQYSLRAAAVWPLAAIQGPEEASAPALGRDTVHLDFETGTSKDSTGYSTLLESGRTRTLRRSSIRLEYQQRLTRASYWVVGLEASAQKANINLFKVHSAGPYLSWRASW